MVLLSGFRQKSGFGSFSTRNLALLAALGLGAVSALAQTQSQPAPLQTDLQIPAPGPMKSTDLGPSIPSASQPSNVNVQARSPYVSARQPNPVPPPPEIAAAMDTFFKGLMRSDVKKSFSGLLAGSRLAAQQDSVDYYTDKIGQAITLYGKVNEYEVYDTHVIGSGRLVETTYISYLAVNPLKWRFVFYRPITEKNWALIKLSISDSIDDLTQ